MPVVIALEKDGQPQQKRHVGLRTTCFHLKNITRTELLVSITRTESLTPKGGCVEILPLN